MERYIFRGSATPLHIAHVSLFHHVLCKSVGYLLRKILLTDRHRQAVRQTDRLTHSLTH